MPRPKGRFEHGRALPQPPGSSAAFPARVVLLLLPRAACSAPALSEELTASATGWLVLCCPQPSIRPHPGAKPKPNTVQPSGTSKRLVLSAWGVDQNQTEPSGSPSKRETRPVSMQRGQGGGPPPLATLKQILMGPVTLQGASSTVTPAIVLTALLPQVTQATGQKHLCSAWRRRRALGHQASPSWCISLSQRSTRALAALAVVAMGNCAP